MDYGQTPAQDDNYMADFNDNIESGRSLAITDMNLSTT